MTELQQLRHISLLFEGQIKKLISENYQSGYVTISPADRLKLLSIRTWSIKYKLSVNEVFRILADYWGPVIEKATKRKRGKRLGVRIVTLVSDKSEDVLKAYIEVAYPSGAHIDAWKSAQQQKQTRLIGIKGLATIKDHIARTHRVRNENKKALDSGDHRKRKYPDSPWL